MRKKTFNDKAVFFAPSSYSLRGWLSVIFALLLFFAYGLNGSGVTIFILSVLAFFIGGELFLIGALKELKKLYVGFNAFLTLNASSAFLFAVLSSMRGGSSLGVRGSALLVPVIFIFANFIKARELGHIKHSQRFMESLDNFISKSVLREEEDGSLKKVFADEIEIDDIIVIKTGERAAVDCLIVDGKTLFDENLITGNVTLAAKQEGDRVFASSVNKGPQVKAKAVSLQKSSQIARILKAVKISEGKKIFVSSPLERYARPVMGFFLLIALTQLCWGLWFCAPEQRTFYISAFLLILSLGGAVPYMAAVLCALKNARICAQQSRVTVNNPYALEVLRKCKTVFIDKTGTLTTGNLEVFSFVPAAGVKEDKLISCAVTAEQEGGNIFSKALREYAKENGIVPQKLISFELYPSFGTAVKTEKDSILAGRKIWLESKGIEVKSPDEEQSKTVFYVAKNGKFLGCVYFTDRLRAGAKNTVAFLKECGRSAVLVSGDNTEALKLVSQRAGIEDFHGNMLPQDKAAKITALSNAGQSIAMIGDGFNDILALLEADVSIAFVSSNKTFESWVDIACYGKDFGVVKKIFALDALQKNVIWENIALFALINLAAVYAVLILQYALAWYILTGLMLFAIGLIMLNSKKLGRKL